MIKRSTKLFENFSIQIKDYFLAARGPRTESNKGDPWYIEPAYHNHKQFLITMNFHLKKTKDTKKRRSKTAVSTNVMS